ncbi:MAG: hypothetical protein IJQ06_00755 [Paludibacteraceae bacterium]|nr:hypothetical protein [Paludibacteraceae bacterium]
MTIAVLDYSTGEVDIIKDCVNLRTNEEVENYLTGVLQYNLDEIHYMFSQELKVNDLTPMDFGVDDVQASRFGVIADIEEKYRSFKNNVCCEPLYARCYVTFNDEENGTDVVIKLTSDKDEKDGEIFFYCDGLDDLVRLCYEENGEDFELTELVEFFNKI